MTLQGILLLDLFGLFLIILMIHLLRARRLHVFYAAVWLLAAVIMMTILSIPPLLEFVTYAVGARYPASAMSLLAFALIVGMLILFSLQLSKITARQVELAQAIALKELIEQEERWGHEQ